MNISIKEQNAINWLIDYTKEHINQGYYYSQEMERGGEVEKGYCNRMLEKINIIKNLEIRINNEILEERKRFFLKK